MLTEKPTNRQKTDRQRETKTDIKTDAHTKSQTCNRFELEHLQIPDDDELAPIRPSFHVEHVETPEAMRRRHHFRLQIGEGDLANRPISGDLLNLKEEPTNQRLQS